MLAPRAVKRKAASKPIATSLVSSAATFDGNIDTGSTGSNEPPSTQASLQQSTSGLQDTSEVLAGVSAATPADSSIIKCDKHTSPVASTSKLSTQAKLEDDTSKVDKEKDLLLHLLVEESLSDWGLSTQYPELRQKLQASKNGYVHLSNLLSIPAIAKETTSIVDITQALKNIHSDIVELDDSGFQVRRRQAPEYESIASTSLEEWAKRSFYVENIPKLEKSRLPDVRELKKVLADLLGTAVEVLRLPQLFTPSDDSKGKNAGPIGPNIGGLFERSSKASGGSGATADGAALSHKVPRKYAFPSHGGPFKGFAFLVLQDPAKAEEAARIWNWDDRGKRQEHVSLCTDSEQSLTAEDEDLDLSEISEESEAEQYNEGSEDNKEALFAHANHQTIKTSAWRSGMYLMPIERFNSLKLEYLRYYREITTIREQYDHSHESFSRSRKRSPSPTDDSGKHKRTPSPERWERKAKSPSPDRWERKPLSPRQEAKSVRRYDDDTQDYPRGCICFVKRFHPDASTRTLKTLFQAILEREELDTKHLQYVDHPRNVDSCHVRFSDASTASFFASYFSGTRKFTHKDASSLDPTEALQTIKKDSVLRPMEVEVMTGIPEAIYWSKVPKSARTSTNTSNELDTCTAAEDRANTEPEEASSIALGQAEQVSSLEDKAAVLAANGDGQKEADPSNKKRIRTDDEQDNISDDATQARKQTRVEY